MSTTLNHTTCFSIPYMLDIFKDLIEVSFSANCVSPCSTHAKTCAASLLCLQDVNVIKKAIAINRTD